MEYKNYAVIEGYGNSYNVKIINVVDEGTFASYVGLTYSNPAYLKPLLSIRIKC